MPEEKKIQKKHGIAKLILKWIYLIVLSLLLIAAILFQAPWKVITLLVIFFLACTVLPKSYRKWFWLSVAAVVIALIVWVFLPDETEGWRPYTFDKESAALEAKYAVPDSENAALIYNQAFEILGSDANEPNFLRDSTRQFWTKKDRPEIAQWLKERKGAIEKLMQASGVEKCYFPISADFKNLNLSTDRLVSMRRCTYLLVSSANNNIAEGRIGRGLEEYLAAMKMAEHIRQQPRLIDMLVGIAIEDLVLNQLKAFAVSGDLTEQHLSAIEEALTKIKDDWTSDLSGILEYEELMPKNMVAMFYEVNQKGETRFSRNPYARARIYSTYWKRKLVKASTVLRWFSMPSTPQKAAHILDTAYEKYCTMAEPDFDWQREPIEPFSLLKGWNFTKIRFNFNYFAEFIAAMTEESYFRLHDIYLRGIGSRRSCQIIIALRHYKNKHGRWPESLDNIENLVSAEVLVDPINGGSFVYRLTDDNFTLYSKGKNNIDEDGQDNSRWDPNTNQRMVEQDDILIWPRRKCDPQKENSNTQ